MLIIFLILNEFSYGKVENLEFIRSNRISKYFYAMHCIFLHKFKQSFHTLLELVCKNTLCLKTILI